MPNSARRRPSPPRRTPREVCWTLKVERPNGYVFQVDAWELRDAARIQILSPTGCVFSQWDGTIGELLAIGDDIQKKRDTNDADA